LISSAPVFAEATLHISDKLVFFQVPDQSVVDHAFDYFHSRYGYITGTLKIWLLQFTVQQVTLL